MLERLKDSEYQRKIDALTERSEDMDNLLIASDVGAIFLDHDLIVRKYTLKIPEYFGILPTDVGRPIGDFASTMNRGDLQQLAEGVLRSLSAEEHEISNRDNRSFLMRLAPYRTAKSIHPGVVMTLIDISKLKAAERLLQKSSEHYRMLFEAAPTAFIKVGPNGSIALANTAAHNMFGYDTDELVGLTIEDLITPSARDQHIQYRKGYAEKPATRSMGSGRDLHAERKDGTEFPIEVGLTPLETEQGPHVLATVVDISERKQLEERKDLLLEVAYAANSMNPNDDSPVGSVILDEIHSDAGRDHGARAFADALHFFVVQARLAMNVHQAQISYVPNGALADGFHLRSFSPKYGKLSLSETVTPITSLWNEIIKLREPICLTQQELLTDPLWGKFKERFEGNHEHPPMRGWLAIPFLSSDHEFIGMVHLSDKYEGDFTPEDVKLLSQLAQLMAPTFALRYANQEINTMVEQRTEQLQEAIAELERSNQQLDEFAYSASHDLRSPMDGVKNLAKWIAEDNEDVLGEKSKRHLKQMQQRISRLGKLLDDLLAFARATRSEDQIENINAWRLIQETIDVLDLPPGFSIEADDLWPTLQTERTPLSQVFRNLIGNAVKHHHAEKGTITLGWRELAGAYEFTVGDDGPGIEPQYHEQIFNMFESIRPRDEVEGSGMGLALVKKIVEFYGGSIAVESVLGQGAKFRFTWPKEKRPTAYGFTS